MMVTAAALALAAAVAGVLAGRRLGGTPGVPPQVHAAPGAASATGAGEAPVAAATAQVALLQLREQNDELMRLLAIQDQALANVSHELRTPLTSILGFCDLLCKRSLDAESMDDLRRIQRNAQVMLDLVNNMLDLSRIEAGRMELTRDRIQLEEVLEAALDIMEPLITGRGLTLELQLRDVPLASFGSFDRLRQVFVNLLSNAVKFTEHGAIHIDSARADGRVAVWIRDTGIGIAPEQLSTVFEAYRQADPSIRRQYGGSGLGLALCRSIVRLHQGDITIESTPGCGTAVCVSLPAAPLVS
jgi:signal transduction histidine kinase